MKGGLPLLVGPIVIGFAGCYCKEVLERPTPEEAFPDGVCAFLAEASGPECAAEPSGCAWVVCRDDWQDRFGLDYASDEAVCDHLAEDPTATVFASAAAMDAAREVCPGELNEVLGVDAWVIGECEFPSTDVYCEAAMCGY